MKKKKKKCENEDSVVDQKRVRPAARPPIPQFLESCKSMNSAQRACLTSGGIEFRVADRSLSASKKHLLFVKDFSLAGLKEAFDLTVSRSAAADSTHFKFDEFEFFIKWKSLKGLIPMAPAPECFLDRRIPWGIDQFMIGAKKLPAAKLKKLVSVCVCVCVFIFCVVFVFQGERSKNG